MLRDYCINILVYYYYLFILKIRVLFIENFISYKIALVLIRAGRCIRKHPFNPVGDIVSCVPKRSTIKPKIIY